jgi:hypothetical protein
MQETDMPRTVKEMEKEIEDLRRERMQLADEKGRWTYERASLLRVIFQLSEALQYEKTH